MRVLVFPVILLTFFFQTLSLSWVSGQCQDDQRLLLLQLNGSLVYDPTTSTKLVRWNQNVDCCKWEGVGCDTVGHVTSLWLDNESIFDGIENSSLFSLVHLEKLNLSLNRFNSSKIPDGFQNLTKLTSLNFSNSGFGRQIPYAISSLRNLISLDLSSLFPIRPSLKLENPSLEMLIENLTSLQELSLDYVDISASVNGWSHAISSSLPDLRYLSLRNCSLSGPLDSLSQLNFLTVLRLDLNNLSSSVPDSFSKLSGLSTLTMSSCSLHGVFPEMILQLPTLQNLDLSNNVFLNGTMCQFPQSGSFRNIDLSRTSFSGSLPDSIGNLQMLSNIDLSWCNFTGPIPPAISGLKELVYLDFKFNSFTGFIPYFHMSKKLKHLDLSSNKLIGQLSSLHFEGLFNLEFINLGANSLNGSIPLSLFGLPALQKLQLANNQFSDQIPELPSASSSNLDTIDLSSNHLVGSIPSWFFRLQKLNVLLLSFNNFTGNLQLGMIQNLPKLTRLELAYNYLKIDVRTTNSNLSRFPQLTRLNLASCKVDNFPDLKGQSRMRFLDLSNNLLSGEVPNWIWEIGKSAFNHLNLSYNFLVDLQRPYQISNTLSILDLHSNKLRGKFPIPPASAIYVDYSSNNFEESIPLSIAVTPVLLFLSLANNIFVGEIPAWLCNVTGLKVLDLSNNLLTGNIPPCLLRNSGSLGVLNLRRNKLNGEIPDVFPLSCDLRTLDLSWNILEGKIPGSLANCKYLEVMNVGNNEIDDTFPCMINTISSLRVLVLRSNQLYGNMTCLEFNQSWPNLQIIDVASNNFNGNLYPKYISNLKRMMEQNDEQSHLSFDILKLNNYYYQDTVTVAIKGLELELVKILTVFTSIDFSNNSFNGEIPEAVGDLISLYSLNLSHNNLSGSIPKSLGKLKMLGSLDLSKNQLTGEIPLEIANLTFLSYLNLSHNKLVGMIPIGSQLQTFPEESFAENTGLCGLPLNARCHLTQPSAKATPSLSDAEFSWQFIFTGVGYGVGAALIFAPLTFCQKWRKHCNDQVEQFLKLIFPSYGFSYRRYNGKLDALQKLEDGPTDDGDYSRYGFSPGRYCVFCTKIDFQNKKVLHDPACTCHFSPPTFSSTTSSSSILFVYRKIL